MFLELSLLKADTILIDILLLNNLYLICTSGFKICYKFYSASSSAFRTLKGKANSLFCLQKQIPMIDIITLSFFLIKSLFLIKFYLQEETLVAIDKINLIQEKSSLVLILTMHSVPVSSFIRHVSAR